MKRLLSPAIIAALMAVSGCASGPNCPSGSVFTEGRCADRHVERSEAHAQHTEEVTKEEREVEEVVKHSAAEEADAIERSTK